MVQWKGYKYEEHSWVNKTDMDALEAIAELYHHNSGASWGIWAISAGHALFHPPHQNAWSWGGVMSEKPHFPTLVNSINSKAS